MEAVFQEKALIKIVTERLAQEARFGKEEAQLNYKGWDNWIRGKMVVLMEEVGELAKEVQESSWADESFLGEAVQVAAVATAIVETVIMCQEKVGHVS